MDAVEDRRCNPRTKRPPAAGSVMYSRATTDREGGPGTAHCYCDGPIDCSNADRARAREDSAGIDAVDDR